MIARRVEPFVAEALADTRVVMIVGPRQAGKSTVAEGFAGEGRRYVTLDDLNAHALATTDPEGFLDTYGAPLIIDEIQRAPGLLLPIKRRVDRDKSPGRYLLTGSANVLALPKVADSLAGRIEVIDLMPLTQAEVEGRPGNFVDRLFGDPLPRSGHVDDGGSLTERVLRGGFPEHVTRSGARRRAQWCESYIRTLLERDVRDLANIEGLTQMPRLLATLAARNGATLNVASLARDVGIPATTLGRYLDLLRKLFLIQDVMPWSANVGTRLVKAPKVYLVDPAIAAFLGNLDAAALAAKRELFGPLLEGFVANELRRLITTSELRPWLMYLRTVRQNEVDFVLESRDRRVVGIEVKATRTPSLADASGLRYLESLARDAFQAGIVLCDGAEVLPLGPKILAVPMAALWENLP